MNIEVHQPKLEALIQQRMASGHFQSIEDAWCRLSNRLHFLGRRIKRTERVPI